MTRDQRRRQSLLSLVVGLCLLCFVGGCKTGVYKDPNDPADAGVLAPEVLRRDLKGISDMLNDRLEKGEITKQDYQDLIEKGANELLDKVNIDRVDPAQAWQYVEVLRTAERWKDAERFARVAVKNAQKTKNPDRLVNDTLRLAQALGHEGKVEEAIATARTVFDAGPTDSGPILPATLYEIVPATRGQGHDQDVAKLLEDAIACHMRTQVNGNDDAGKLFLAARPTHVRRAWNMVIELYEAAGDKKAVQESARKANAMVATFGRA